MSVQTTIPTRRDAGGAIDHIRVDGVSRVFGDRRVLTDVSLVVPPNARIGLIGENGAGKSTLLRIIAGADEPDTGAIARPADTGILWQEVPRDADDTVADLLERALSRVRAIERELEAAAADISSERGAARYARALEAAERADVWAADARRDEVLAALGLDGIPSTRRLDAVSGGQRSRLALAALLLRAPEALLLDEPTNHLDDTAVAYLRDRLLRWSGPVLFASHDRAFLDEVATGLVDLDPGRSSLRADGGVTVFGGAFSAYLDEKERERERWEAQYAAEQEELKRLEHAVDVTARSIAFSGPPRDNDKFARDFKAGTLQKQISRRVANARSRLDDLREHQVRKPPRPLSFAGIPSGSHPLDTDEVLVSVTDADVRGRLRLDRLRVEARTRLLVTGSNGAGKSTLLGVVAGGVPLDSGSVSVRRGTRIRLLEQDVAFADPSLSPRRIYETTIGGRRAEQVPLSSLGLVPPRDLDRPVGALSVGQQRRVALALIIARPPHLFLLDEPTNHLSLSLATELEEALGGYPGAVVIASHDRWLRRRWEGEELALAAV